MEYSIRNAFFNLLMDKILKMKYNLPTKKVSAKSWMSAATRAAVTHNIKQMERQMFTGGLRGGKMTSLNAQLNIAAFETLLIKLDVLHKRFLF